MRRALLVGWLVVLGAGCGRFPTPDASDGGTSSGALVKEALGAPSGLLALEALTASQGAQAIWLASAATGTPTLSGVLTQGATGWTYAPGGSVLELHFATGVVGQYTFTTFQGDTSGTAQHYLDAPHSLGWRFVDGLKTDLTCSETRTSTSTSGSIAGTWTDEGTVQWTANLSWSGTSSGTVAPTWADTTQTLQLSGTANGNQGTAVTVSETVVDHTAESSSTRIQKLDRAVTDRWTDGAGAWTVQDLRLKKAFTNGTPDDDPFWLAQGSVLLDGGVVGTLSLQHPSASSYDVVLTMNGQTTTVLESTATP